MGIFLTSATVISNRDPAAWTEVNAPVIVRMSLFVAIESMLKVQSIEVGLMPLTAEHV